jgi:fatty acid desaturase
VLGVFIWLDPVKALILFVLPMPIMHIGLLDNTYMQHSDLDLSSDFTASRNSTSRLYNFISWNLGYHTAHHIKPNLHWSKLPAYHDSIKQQIPEGVMCDSVLLSACSYRHSKEQPKERQIIVGHPVVQDQKAYWLSSQAPSKMVG